MGLAVVDRGKMELRKYFDPKGNDPEVVAKFLEDAKKQDVYIHLRYRTRGARDKENVHPFGILKNAKHGIDIQFMHNGTLTDFGNATDCDSKDFVKSILTPVSERFIKSIDPGQLLHDPVYTAILDKYAGKGSVFLLFDNLGNHRIVNYDNGKDFTGWWASNEYSFNRSHRSPVSNTSDDFYYRGKGYNNRVQDYSQPPKKTVSLAEVPKADKKKENPQPPFNDEVPFNTEAANDKKGTEKKQLLGPTLPSRERFIDVAKIKTLSEVCALSSDDIKDMVDDYPEEATLLILDLLKELYDRDQEYDDYADAYEKEVA
jgi:hypothetical protein